jgi:hypothetical protein
MIYRHYKGDLYRVLFGAMESTNDLPRRQVVVYVSLKTGEINCRSAEEFFGMVDGKPRFEVCNEII